MNGDIDMYTYTSSFKHKTETLKWNYSRQNVLLEIS